MSDYLGRIAGATAGFFLSGGTPQGAQIGWTLGSFVDGPQGKDTYGPRMGDATVQSSALGAPLPILYGKDRFAGNVIWALPYNERAVKSSSGDKGGGPSHTDYETLATFAVSICEGEAYCRRIWAYGKLIYDLGDTASLESIIASNKAADGFTFYSGSETQMPDPLIQAAEGVENTQAYLGTAYVVIENMPVDEYGKQVPQLMFEMVKSSSTALRKVSEVSTPVSDRDARSLFMDGASGETVLSIRRPVPSDHRFDIWVVQADGSQSLSGTLDIDSEYDFFDIPGGQSDEAVIIAAANGSAGVYFPNAFKVYFFDPYTAAITKTYWLTFDGNTVSATARGEESTFQIKNGVLYVLTSSQGALDLALFKKDLQSIVTVDEPTMMEQINSEFDDLTSGSGGFVVHDETIYVLNSDDTIITLDLNGVYQSTITLSPTPTVNPILYGGFWGEAKSWLFYDDDALFICDSSGYLHRVTLGGDYSYIGDLALPLSAFSGLDSCLISGGLLRYYNIADDVLSYYQLFGRDTSADALLSDIQEDIFTRSAVTSFDVSALTDVVEGYKIARPMSGRAASEPLQQAFLYDVVEKNNVTVCVKRGAASMVDIPEDELGASENGDTPLITHNRQQEPELPSKVIVRYIDIDRDYQQGSEFFSRINAPVENVVILDLPIVMSATKAKQLAEIHLVTAWTERDGFSVSLTTDYLALNPADVITPTAYDVARSMRISKASYGSIIQLECVSQDVQMYESDAVAEPTNFVTQSVKLDGPTKLHLLDIPLLRNTDNDAGMYAAAAGYLPAWSGASLYKSLDSGVSYTPQASILNAATMGVATNILAEHTSATWDRTNSLNVSMLNGALSSITEALALAGAVYLLIGDEVVCFVNAVLEVDGSYTLDTFIRGRRGTEWAVGSHVENERVVLLNENAIRRVDAQLAIPRDYKAVTFNTYIDEAANYTVTNTGVSLKPFAPTLVKATRDADDVTFTWAKRTRYIGTALWKASLFEESEAYEVDVMDDATVLRTLTSSSEMVVYTSALQTTDGLTPGEAVTIIIYQISATAGRGYGTEATL